MPCRWTWASRLARAPRQSDESLVWGTDALRRDLVIRSRVLSFGKQFQSLGAARFRGSEPNPGDVSHLRDLLSYSRGLAEQVDTAA